VIRVIFVLHTVPFGGKTCCAEQGFSARELVGNADTPDKLCKSGIAAY
jgi:hypothetical protein